MPAESRSRGGRRQLVTTAVVEYNFDINHQNDVEDDEIQEILPNIQVLVYSQTQTNMINVGIFRFRNVCTYSCYAWIRLEWTGEIGREPNTGTLCDIWIDQINKGNCVKGTMNKIGMREVIGRYFAATNLVHDRVLIANWIRQLKGLWQFVQRLRNDTGLGRRDDGTTDAIDQWWEDNTKVLAKIRVCCFTSS